MAVGKTTAINELLKINNNYVAIYENAISNNELFKSIYTKVDSIFGRDLKQLIYLYDIIERTSKVNSDVIIYDKGIEDILFF